MTSSADFARALLLTEKIRCPTELDRAHRGAAHLVETNLTHAVLCGANLRKAQLDKANSTQEQRK